MKTGAVLPLMTAWTLAAQDIHWVLPSPTPVPSKVTACIVFLQEALAGANGRAWWQRSV